MADPPSAGGALALCRVVEKNLNAGRIAATLSRAGQIIQRKSIDQREQTQAIEEMISNHGEH